jgi:hypothetical protein
MAVVLLAIIGAPMMSNMIIARRSMHSSIADVNAVSEAGRILTVLTTVGYERLPVHAQGSLVDLGMGVLGVPRPAWTDAFDIEDGARISLHGLLGEDEPVMTTTYLGIREVDDDERGLGAIPTKEVTVHLRYQASGADIAKERRLTIRAVVPRSPGI